jgi:hypothetical protein
MQLNCSQSMISEEFNRNLRRGNSIFMNGLKV